MVFKFLKKRPQLTFKNRVTEFWEWYSGVAERFFETIEDGRCADLTDEVAAFMNKTLPGMAWVFGPGEKGGHSFTVSGEGNLAKQFLAEYWHSRAPDIPTWTFYASRQPSPPERLIDFAIRVGGNLCWLSWPADVPLDSLQNHLKTNELHGLIVQGDCRSPLLNEPATNPFHESLLSSFVETARTVEA